MSLESERKTYYADENVLGGNKDSRELLSSIDHKDPDTDIYNLKNSFDRLRIRFPVLEKELGAELEYVRKYLPERNSTESRDWNKDKGDIEIDGKIDLTDPTENNQKMSSTGERKTNIRDEIDYLEQIVFTDPEIVERELEIVETVITQEFYRLCEEVYQGLGIGSYDDDSEGELRLSLADLVQGLEDYGGHDPENLTGWILNSQELNDFRDYLAVFELSGDLENEISAIRESVPDPDKIEEFDRLIDDERYQGIYTPKDLDQDFSEMSPKQVLQEFNFRKQDIEGKEDIRSGFRELIKRHHPDHGGDRKKFEAVMAARDSVRSEIDI